MNLFDQTRQFHQDGNFEQAARGYQTLLAAEPENPHLCYLLALLYFDQGKIAEACHWFSATVRLAPEAAPAHYNLGVIFFNQGDYLKAAQAYEQAARHAPEDGDIFFNLALAWKKLGRFEAAVASYEKVLALSPGDTEALYNIGLLYKEMGQAADSIRYLEEVTANNADHGAALSNLAYLYHREGATAQAIATYQKLIALDHHAAMAGHMLAALSGLKTSSAPAAYVREVFDSFSDHYDESLVGRLGYTTPTLLRGLLDAAAPRRFQATLDMGCGTGLSGQAFRELTQRLVGLDLSPKMLSFAGPKGLYDSLHETEISAYLQAGDETFDLFLAADVFVYSGDLGEIFRLVRQRAATNALFLLSTELADQGFCLKTTGRYGHAETYIRALAAEHGFTVLTVAAADIRKEKGEWIPGNLYMLTTQEAPELT